MLKSGSAVFALLMIGAGSAKSTEDCYPRGGKIDVCNIARAISTRVSKDLPQRLNRETTAEMIIAAGPRLTLLGIVDFHSRNMTQAGISAFLAAARERAAGICGDAGVREMVKLGGSFEYMYKTSDGKIIGSATVQACD